MTTTDFSYYYVTKPRRSINSALECYGSHATVESALVDQLHRAYDFNQKTSIYGVKHNGEIVKIS